MTLSCVTTPGPDEPLSDDNEEVLHIPQSSSITGNSPSDCLVSYQDNRCGDLTALQRCSGCILQSPQPTGPQDTCRGGGLTQLQRCSWCILQLPTANLLCYVFLVLLRIRSRYLLKRSKIHLHQKYIFINPSTQAGCDTRSISKRSFQV